MTSEKRNKNPATRRTIASFIFLLELSRSLFCSSSVYFLEILKKMLLLVDNYLIGLSCDLLMSSLCAISSIDMYFRDDFLSFSCISGSSTSSSSSFCNKRDSTAVYLIFLLLVYYSKKGFFKKLLSWISFFRNYLEYFWVSSIFFMGFIFEMWIQYVSTPCSKLNVYSRGATFSNI